MNSEEMIIFLKMLPNYFDHLMSNPNSIIARVYGIYKVKLEDIVPVNLILMANTIRCKSSNNIMNVFDLKGSVINRIVPFSKDLKPTSTLKD